MKKIRTAAAKQIRNVSQPKLTIGLDLGDRSSWYCLLDGVGEVLLEQKRSDKPRSFRSNTETTRERVYLNASDGHGSAAKQLAILSSIALKFRRGSLVLPPSRPH